jgi:hypothetical protein
MKNWCLCAANAPKDKQRITLSACPTTDLHTASKFESAHHQMRVPATMKFVCLPDVFFARGNSRNMLNI